VRDDCDYYRLVVAREPGERTHGSAPAKKASGRTRGSGPTENASGRTRGSDPTKNASGRTRGSEPTNEAGPARTTKRADVGADLRVRPAKKTAVGKSPVRKARR
jgi:hypothetical protein